MFQIHLIWNTCDWSSADSCRFIAISNTPIWNKTFVARQLTSGTFSRTDYTVQLYIYIIDQEVTVLYCNLNWNHCNSVSTANFWTPNYTCSHDGWKYFARTVRTDKKSGSPGSVRFSLFRCKVWGDDPLYLTSPCLVSSWLLFLSIYG